MAERKPFRRRGEAEKAKRRPVLDRRGRELLVAVMLRNEAAFKALRDRITPALFKGVDPGLGLALSVAAEHYDQYGVLPEYDLILHGVEEALDENPSQLVDTERSNLTQTLEWAFGATLFQHGAANPIYAEWAVKVARKLLDENLAERAVELQARGTVPVDMPDLLRRLHVEAEQIATLSAGSASAPFPVGWHEEIAVPVFSTGISFIDKFLGGGHAAGEVYGLLAPFGSCKTTLAFMLAVRAAYHFQSLADGGGPVRVAFVISYEARVKEMRQRALGFAARVHRRTIEEMKSDGDLSRAGAIKDYERRMFHQEIARGEKVQGEYERVQDALRILNKHIAFVDLTGHDRRGVGGGGVKEIGREIAAELQRRGTAGTEVQCGLAVLDYAGAMVTRQMAAHDVPVTETRHYIKNTPILLKSEVADAYDCPAWVLHQLSGDANSRPPSHLPHYTDSSESKSFAENLDFCFTAGNLNPEQVGRFGCGKHRRQPPTEDTLIRVDGGMYRVLCVEDKYVIDAGQKRILSKYEAGRLPGGLPAQAAPAATVTVDVNDDSDPSTGVTA